MLSSSSIAGLPAFELEAGDGRDDPFDVFVRQRRRAAPGVERADQFERDEGVNVPAQQIAGEFRQTAIACAFANALDQITPFRWRRGALAVAIGGSRNDLQQ